MDWTNFIGNTPFGAFVLPQPGSPASSAADAPMNILPAVAQTSPTQPVGILNGQQKPNQDDDKQLALLSQAQKLISPQATPVPPMWSPAPLMPPPQVDMARPLGSQGINPLQFLTAFNRNPLGSAPSGMGS